VDQNDLDGRLGSLVERLKHEAGGSPSAAILDSWRRCTDRGLDTDRLSVPYRPDFDNRGRLAMGAGAALDRAGADLEGTSVGLLLTDEQGHVVARRAGSPSVASLLDTIDLAPGFVYSEGLVGTNAIGTALELRGPSTVQAYEHFADALTGMACAASPITDPTTGRVFGVVDLSCAADQATSLMLPLAKRIAWEIEQRLLDETTYEQRVLREHFLTARRSTRGPLLSINDSNMIVSGAAAAVVHSSDRERIWHWVTQALCAKPDVWSELTLSSGQRVLLRCEPAWDADRLVGAIVYLDQGERTRKSAEGWPSLTPTERAVAYQVAQGLTNAEIAAQLVLSPHTIDYHLRQIFRKLDVHGRVELTRAVVAGPQEAIGSAA